MTTRECPCETTATQRLGLGSGSSMGVSPRPRVKSASDIWKRESLGIERSYSGMLLHDAITRGDAKEAFELLKNDADPDYRPDARKMTSLMVAISSIRRDLVRLLLDAQADPAKKDAMDRDAMDHLDLAVNDLRAKSEGVEERMRGISEMLQNDGKTMAKGKKAEKLSELASCQEELDSLAMLQDECRMIGRIIEKKLDLILFEAAQSDDLERAVQAIEAGADPIIFDREGRSPYMIAKEKGYSGLAAYLKNDLDETLQVLQEDGDQEQIMAAIRAGAEPMVIG